MREAVGRRRLLGRQRAFAHRENRYVGGQGDFVLAMFEVDHHVGGIDFDVLSNHGEQIRLEGLDNVGRERKVVRKQHEFEPLFGRFAGALRTEEAR